MAELTEKQKVCLDFFKKNLPDWLKDELRKNKYVVISDESVKGIFDTIDNAVDYAYDNYELGSFIIQEIIDENDTVSFLRMAVA